MTPPPPSLQSTHITYSFHTLNTITTATPQRSPNSTYCSSSAPTDASATSEGGQPNSGGEEDDEYTESSEWLQDYKSGMEYEVYSLLLRVPATSRVWGMTFDR